MGDYGKVSNDRGITWLGSDKEPSQIKYTQVYSATHGAHGYLPYMKRSFISFSFGGKNIEDFNLIATINNNRLQKKGYSEFEDLTSDYEVLDGHFYWGTHYTNHTLDFELATDAMTQNELDSFLRWFSAGQVRELILSEHPNRAVKARVSAAPDLHLLPFEEKTTKKIAGQDYNTSTTLYKGEISLSFVMDEPYWYSKINIFGYLNETDGIYYDVWTDANGNEGISVYDDPDAVKIALEDNIPIAGMIQDSMLLGNNSYANSNETTDGARVAELETYTETIDSSGAEPVVNVAEEVDEQSRIAIVDENDIWQWGARITGTIMSISTGIENFSSSDKNYFYYAGTAPSAPIIEFTLTPVINEQGYISNPKNSYTNPDTPYNIFFFESLTKKELYFTTPSIYTGYNQTIRIFEQAKTKNLAWVDIRNQIRDYVNHPAARAWANKVIDKVSNGSTVAISANLITAISNMSYFIKDTDGSILPSTFIIDNKNGRAIAKLGYRGVNNNNVTEWSTYGTIYKLGDSSDTRKEEDVGDMIRSNYLVIEDQNQPNEDGHIVGWNGATEQSRLYSHIIGHDVVNGLTNVFVKYQNMYL